MSRVKVVALPGAVLAAIVSCSPPSPSPSPSLTSDPPSGPQPDSELTAVALGVTVDARDDRGAPRLVRAVVPRAAAAGMTAEQAARDHLAALAPLWIAGQRGTELAAQTTQQLRNGAAIVRLQQQIDHVDIHQGELRVMVRPDGSLAAISGMMRSGGGHRAAFRSTPAAAVERALDALFGAARSRPAITPGAARAGYQELTVPAAPGLRVQSARARRELLPDGDRLVPIWSVEVLAEKPGFDDRLEPAARRYLIADADGRVLREVDLTASDAFVYRAFAETTGDRRPLDGALDSFAPHPTGVPDGSLPGAAPYNLVAIEAFNAPHDPWLGLLATTTSGNNVEAFADITPPTGFNDGDVRPEVRAGRTLNYRYDFTAGPLATVTQSKAAAVNVFFVTNWLHDWYYDSGFTEATGNAQADNFGRGGAGGDPLLALAQANALGGSRDNAFMTTPDDGLSPSLHMFLWSGAAQVSLATPTATPLAVAFVNGPRSFDLTAAAVLAQDATGTVHDACGPVTGVAGLIAVIDFDGRCGSAAAVNNVKAVGAIGVIARFATPGAPAVALGGSATANLPGLVIGDADGLALEASLPATVTLHGELTLEHDGDLDNAVVAHEWGHYLHHRLASCEAVQCSAISEGWGDFVALHMMLRETDDRRGTFAAGLYAYTAGGVTASGFTRDPGYFGLRRFPYSTDRSKNALSFRHISTGAALPDTPVNLGPARNGNAEVHNAGEVWATMMWEAYSVLLDEHAYAEARRRMSDYVVAGLLLNPPDATYTEARDALLAAAGALDTDDMLLMAAAFAGRGAGTCAVSPGRETFDLLGVVESGTIAARLEAGAIAVSDDAASCDHDGYLDPGESGTVRVTVANSGALAAEGVVVTATTTTPGVTLGKRFEVGDLAALSQVDVAIPIRLALSAPTDARLDLQLTIEGDAGCNTRRLVIPFHAPIGVDEAAAVATSDGLETHLVAWTPTGAGAGEVWRRAAEPSGNHVLFGSDTPFPSDTQLVSPVLQASPTQPLVVSVAHGYDLEDGGGLFFDGGMIEVSSDGGAIWRDVTAVGVDPGYPATLVEQSGNPLEGRACFSGKNPAFPDRDRLVLDFGTRFAGQPVQLRFRMGSDLCCGATGWSIDDIAVTGITNTPFPGLVPEPTRCLTARTASDAGDAGVIATHRMPRASLDGVPGAAEAP